MTHNAPEARTMNEAMAQAATSSSWDRIQRRELQTGKIKTNKFFVTAKMPNFQPTMGCLAWRRSLEFFLFGTQFIKKVEV